MMDELRLADLRKLAEEATPGPWPVQRLMAPRGLRAWLALQSSSGTNVAQVRANRKHVPNSGYGVSSEWEPEGQGLADATFISAANPQTVLSLLDALDAARAERDEALRAHEQYHNQRGQMFERAAELIEEMPPADAHFLGQTYRAWRSRMFEKARDLRGMAKVVAEKSAALAADSEGREG